MPRISVIASAYNMENGFSFRHSIESILAQTLGDFEFLICDDGSTDGTFRVLSEYAKSDSRIRLVKNIENIGLGASLNRLAHLSCADYLARHDFDDISKEDRLQKQISYMEAHPDIAILGTQALLFDEGGAWGERKFPLVVKKSDFLFRSPYMHGSVMMRKSAFLLCGGYKVSKETRRAEDYDLFMRMAERFGGANLDEYLYLYCEDKNTLRRRKYRYRIDEVKVRYEGFRRLGLLPRGLPYVIKPLAVGLIPQGLLSILKGAYYGKKSKGGNDEE